MSTISRFRLGCKERVLTALYKKCPINETAIAAELNCGRNTEMHLAALNSLVTAKHCSHTCQFVTFICQAKSCNITLQAKVTILYLITVVLENQVLVGGLISLKLEPDI